MSEIASGFQKLSAKRSTAFVYKLYSTTTTTTTIKAEGKVKQQQQVSTSIRQR